MPAFIKNYAFFAVISLFVAPEAFAYGDFNARIDCFSKVAPFGSEYSSPQDVRSDETGLNSFNVSGKVNDKQGNKHNFDCRIEHKEVVSWNVSHDDSGKKKNKTGKVLAIGAGIVGVAALAAIIASSKSGDQTHDDSRTTYNSGKANPFDDMRYLRSECRRVVRQHLVRDHGAVDDLDLEQANLNGRILSGEGRVLFEAGSAHNLTYTCNFDRSGNVYDGNYNYRGGR
ncbi:hypothetical protein GL272_14000 [Aeromonas veronii]|uniref:hypothetical protein n=1 Tax=Aeromonas veronii TaxID=654 RepID=UPI001302315E|nr:hypothetical protein [Aeromonas veronii]KAE9625325.1 hypothetical protein GO627_08015 [Aeromonas veronii]MBW3778024.1 hypothetical protein [Aeromonas veronii]